MSLLPKEHKRLTKKQKEKWLAKLPISAQLLKRHWIITDANNVQQEVRGGGVVGETPKIAPGEHYTYTSGIVLETKAGTMEGYYQMRTDDGLMFDAPIPVFALTHPKSLH